MQLSLSAPAALVAAGDTELAKRVAVLERLRLVAPLRCSGIHGQGHLAQRSVLDQVTQRLGCLLKQEGLVVFIGTSRGVVHAMVRRSAGLLSREIPGRCENHSDISVYLMFAS